MSPLESSIQCSPGKPPGTRAMALEKREGWEGGRNEASGVAEAEGAVDERRS